MRLRPTNQVDVEWLRREVLGSPSTGIRWRFRGVTPDEPEFSQAVSSGVVVQFLIENAESQARCGLVQLMNYDRRNGTAKLTYVVDRTTEGRSWHMEAAFLFVNYCFMSFPLRKIYIESLDYSIPGFKSGIGRWFEEEGVLREHEYYDGKWLDLHIYAIHRATWENARESRPGLFPTSDDP